MAQNQTYTQLLTLSYGLRPFLVWLGLDKLLDLFDYRERRVDRAQACLLRLGTKGRLTPDSVESVLQRVTLTKPKVTARGSGLECAQRPSSGFRFGCMMGRIAAAAIFAAVVLIVVKIVRKLRRRKSPSSEPAQETCVKAEKK